MSRPLTGDVGSGKTAVAFFPLIVAARAGRRGVLLAPTEILARQHVRARRSRRRFRPAARARRAGADGGRALPRAPPTRR
jgi:ATP-dependent DNA helicase RecG